MIYKTDFFNIFPVTKLPEESVQDGEVSIHNPNICNDTQKVKEVRI